MTAGARGAVPPAAIVLLAMLAIAWGTFWPLSKFVLAEMPLFTFRGLCGGLAGVFLLGLAAFSGRSLRVSREELPHLLLMALFSTTGWLYFSAVAVLTMGAGRAALIAYTMPLWAFLLGIWILGDKPTARRWLGLAIGLSGIAVLVSEDVGRILGNPLGAAASLLGAMSWGMGSVLMKRRRWSTPDLALVGWQQLLGGAPLLVLAVLTEHDRWGPMSPLAWGGFAWNVLLGTVFGTWAWFKIVKMLPIGLATLGTLMVPVVGLLASAVLVAEPITGHSLVALMLILGGLTTVLPLPRIPLPWRQRPPAQREDAR